LSIVNYLSLVLPFSRIFLIAAILSSCDKKGWVDTHRIMQRDAEPENWLTLGGNYQMQHYSPLMKITAENVSTLGFAWEYDASSRRGRVQRGQEATPIVVDGLMYASGPWGVVYAIDAKTGAELWRYDPEVDGNYARRACCDVVNRGVAVWEEKVYVGVLDGFLVCLDAKTGRMLWRTDTIIDRERFYTITSPPQVAGDVVVIGNSGGEFGARGYITAYDLETGEQAWRFYTVPGDPKNGFEHAELEEAAKTWDPNSNWGAGLGGTSWGEMTYDPLLNLLYVGTGNSSPYPIWHRSPSGGDNLFLASILAIDPSNGKLKWHYQTTPGEIWDYTCTSTMTLADLDIAGSARKVLMTAPKNGFYYVLDRKTGELISANNFVPVNWASEIDLQTGRPVLTGNGWYKDEPKIIYPGPAGGHNWQPMSFSPVTGLAYIPAMHLPFYYESKKEFTYNKDDNTGMGAYYPRSEPLPNTVGEVPDEEAYLLAWDPVAQREMWRVKMSTVDFNGGVMSTGSNLVFEGTVDGFFVVYDAMTGKELMRIETGTGIIGAPVTYEVDGEQYVAVMAGYGGAPLPFYPKGAAMERYVNNGRILAFKLGGGATPLPKAAPAYDIPAPPEGEVSEARVIAGEKLYRSYCAPCHAGFGKDHNSGYPDLSRMVPATHDMFNKIVLDGAYSAYGMARFDDVLKPEDADAIHDFLMRRQTDVYGEYKVTTVRR
jgi:quinohemoprotein ethanol dehydrogenase